MEPGQPYQSKPRTTIRRIKILVSTTVTAILAIAFVLFATDYISDRAGKTADIVHVEPTLVLVKELKPQTEYRTMRRFVGQIEPGQRTDMAFEFGGTVVKILVDEGETVEVGEMLARLDTRSLENQKTAQQAARRAIEAKLELARLTSERRNALEKSGFTSVQAQDSARFALAEIEAHLLEIDALLYGIELKLDKAVIRAPFRAYVGSRVFDEGGIAGAGQPVLTLLQMDNVNVRVGVPPVVAGKLRKGDPVEIEILDQVLKGTIRSLRPDLEKMTQTRTVLVSLDADPEVQNVLFGQTCRVRFEETVKSRGYWVPVTALSEGVRGLWSLKVVDRKEDGTAFVRTEAVEVLHLSDSAAYVRGTFGSEVTIVATGQHRVVSGQEVRVAAR